MARLSVESGCKGCAGMWTFVRAPRMGRLCVLAGGHQAANNPYLEAEVPVVQLWHMLRHPAHSEMFHADKDTLRMHVRTSHVLQATGTHLQGPMETTPMTTGQKAMWPLMPLLYRPYRALTNPPGLGPALHARAQLYRNRRRAHRRAPAVGARERLAGRHRIGHGGQQRGGSARRLAARRRRRRRLRRARRA